MAFNLRKQKIAIAPIPPLGDVAINTDSPFRLSWIDAVNKVMPSYMAQDPGITNIDNAMSLLQKTPEQVMEDAMAINPEMMQNTEEAVDDSQIAKDILRNNVNANSNKAYNLKTAKTKTAQMDMQVPMDPMGLNDSPELMGDQFEEQQNVMSTSQPPFAKIEEFRNWADNTETSQVLQQIAGPNGDHLKEAMEQYYSSDDEGVKGQIAAQIFSDPSFPLREEQGIMGQPKHFGEVDDAIKKVAQTTAKKYKAKVFNLSKTAQHKTIDNAILWGPGQSQIDPFLHQPVSDWHIVERNKGFGLVVDDIWNIDYETIWRENIMDKYSRPYKDKEGNWVGGYIQKRFEVDKNIPEANNMQLKPGQLRKPILPEYGNTESRLQAARAAGDIEGAIDTSKPFNWKEASSKKKS